MKAKYKTLKGSALLMTAALVWGLAFVAQNVGLKEVEPLTFNGIRMIMGTVTLLPFILISDRRKTKKTGEKPLPLFKDKVLLKGGLICGVLLFVASTFQNLGIMNTTVGKAGFITALYVLFVPILGIFLKRKTGKNVWIGVVIALVGMYFLCINETLSFNKGDMYILICAFCYTFHITVISYFSPRVDGLKLSAIQFFVCGVISLAFMPFFEGKPDISVLLDSWLPIVYAGVLSSGIGFTFQVLAQRDLSPVVASIISSFESVFALIGGMIILHEMPTSRELFGCVLMFAAIIIAQLPNKVKAVAAPKNC